MNYKFRRQFLFGPADVIEKFPLNWPTIGIGEQTLTHHPDLKVTPSSAEARDIFLIGFAFHCYHTDFKTEDIVKKLSGCSSHKEFLDEMDCLCGTFVIIEVKGDNISFYNDVASAGKIFYRKDPKGNVVGSDPMIIKEVISLERDNSPEAKEFYDSYFFKEKGSTRKWLGDRTYYRSLYQVLPNHVLDYRKQNVTRYFPREKREELPLHKVIEKSSSLMKNLSNAVFSQKKVYVSITAGWDSRVVVATTKDHSDKAVYFTFDNNKNITVNNLDMSISEKICQSFNLEHKILKHYTEIPAPHKDVITSSYELINPFRFWSFLRLAENMPDRDAVALNGNISEIAKNYYERLPLNSGKQLARAAHYPKVPYVVEYFQEWLDNNKEVIEKYDYSTPDFAHWEQDITNFAGQAMFHTSYAVEQVSFYNCRELIRTLLQSNIKYRDGHSNTIYSGIINNLWPDLLRYPVNPSLKRQMIVLTKKLRIYDLYKRIWHKF